MAGEVDEGCGLLRAMIRRRPSLISYLFGLSLIFSAGCAHGPGGWVGPLHVSATSTNASVTEAVELFYTASTADEMERATNAVFLSLIHI